MHRLFGRDKNNDDNNSNKRQKKGSPIVVGRRRPSATTMASNHQLYQFALNEYAQMVAPSSSNDDGQQQLQHNLPQHYPQDQPHLPQQGTTTTTTGHNSYNNNNNSAGPPMSYQMTSPMYPSSRQQPQEQSQQYHTNNKDRPVRFLADTTDIPLGSVSQPSEPGSSVMSLSSSLNTNTACPPNTINHVSTTNTAVLTPNNNMNKDNPPPSPPSLRRRNGGSANTAADPLAYYYHLEDDHYRFDDASAAATAEADRHVIMMMMVPDSSYEEYYGDAYVGAPLKYIYPSGYQSMRPRGGPWKLSIVVCIIFTWLSVFIVGHCSDSAATRMYNTEIDDDAIKKRWCGSRILYMMWVMSMSITGVAAAYCSVIGYIKVRDFSVANCRSQPSVSVGKSDYYIQIHDDDHHSVATTDTAPDNHQYRLRPSQQQQQQQNIYQADGTPRFWGTHIYRPTQAAVAVTSR